MPTPPFLWDANVAELKEISYNEYRPDGMTAMLDGVAATIDKLELQDDIRESQVAVLMLIISDGMENNSRIETYESVSERVKRLSATGRWTFTYLGSNQDLSQAAQNLNIPVGNVQAFASTPMGTKTAYASMSTGTQSYFERRATGQTQTSSFYQGGHPSTDDPLKDKFQAK
ncbi:hypothetical protein MYX65_00660 [Acidobacteria bacterium AH-259-L09]|nr:hypothetical protein [Acidobacteria bacterium AH-259-L09]